MSATATSLMDEAYNWITEGHGITECLRAIRQRRGNAYINADDFEPTNVCAHLEQLSGQAHDLGDRIRAAGFDNLGKFFHGIDRRLRALAARGRDDVQAATEDLVRLACAVENEIERLDPRL